MVAHAFDAVTARLEIEKTLCRYAWAWDFEFARGIGACFTEDVVGDFGVNVATGDQSGVTRADRRWPVLPQQALPLGPRGASHPGQRAT